MPMIEIPAHVQHESFVQNTVTVQGGTNWDLSRTAVETPITRLPEPEPVIPPVPSNGYAPENGMPEGQPTVVVNYGPNSVILSKQAAAELKALSKKSTVIVAGHADQNEKHPASLAQRRAKAVAATLRRQGHKVEAVKSFSAEIPKSYLDDGVAENRRVEVFER